MSRGRLFVDGDRRGVHEKGRQPEGLHLGEVVVRIRFDAKGADLDPVQRRLRGRHIRRSFVLPAQREADAPGNGTGVSIEVLVIEPVVSGVAIWAL